MSSSSTATTRSGPGDRTNPQPTKRIKEGDAGICAPGKNIKVYDIPMSMYAENRAKLVARFSKISSVPEKSLILMKGGEEECRNESDFEPIFRQESSFHYLFGVREPGFYATIDTKTGYTTLYCPRLPEDYAIYMGNILSPQEFLDIYQVDKVLYVDELLSSITESKPEKLYVNKGLNTDSGAYATPATFEGIDKFSVEDTILYPEIVECRVFKSERELELLQYVNDISSDAHLEVMSRCKPGMMEYQLESIFLHYGYFHGACRHVSYTSICGCGPNSAVLHYGHAGAPNDRPILETDMLLLDMGAEYKCYTSDITCSFPANGKFSDDQKMIFETVQAMQFGVFEALRPGVMWLDMHELSYKIAAEKLKQAGLLKGNVDEMMEVNLISYFMPHGLGHFMGVDVHDVGGYNGGLKRDTRLGYKNCRTVREVKPNMVLTVEPGIYFIPHLMEKLKADDKCNPFVNLEVLARFHGFGGVRLEDDIVITENGMRNMTTGPRTVEDVEAVMAGKITDKSQLFKKF